MAIKSKEVLQDLSKDKLKSYIFFLTQKYYASYVQGDVEEYKRAIEHLFFVVEEYGDKYVNLKEFVCFCMYVNANAELMNMRDKQDFKLAPLFKVDLLEDDAEELAHDIKNIFNKDRIRERYNEKATHEHVE